MTFPSEPAGFLDAYGDAWQRREPEGIASFYEFPAMVVTPGGVVHLADAGEAAGHFGRIVAANWDDLAHPWPVTDLQLQEAGGHAVLASLRWVGRASDGTPLGDHAHTYLLADTGSGWRILADVVHA